MTRIAAIHQPHYLPWLRYFDKIAKADVFILLDDVQYSKNGWQNRNRFKGSGGAYRVTVPVRHRFACPLPEVEIDGDAWRRAHLASLRTSYGRSPGLSGFGADLTRLLSRPWKRLVDLNREVLALFLAVLDIRTPCLRSSEIEVAGTATDRLANLCRAVGASHYLSGEHASQVYLDPTVLAAQGIGLLHHRWVAPVYAQAHLQAGFAPDLSIVDLVAATGKEARDVLAAAGRVEPPGSRDPS